MGKAASLFGLCALEPGRSKRQGPSRAEETQVQTPAPPPWYQQILSSSGERLWVVCAGRQGVPGPSQGRV